ncbi:hypothetical protein [Natrinema ejinorense]|uniref:Uncharacterized protein n=1 Tax=Natrinema ejinorense TaxID=373386 RepID=A0A2A5QP69_9EURY|nr:hypothetical protein [Natrinema ejinorense]PCR88614.1 hypothetical protein CP557_21505 [Natrinema ejinorense]
MTLTTAVTDGYRRATDRFIETDWTHAAGVFFATQLATAVWMLYLLVTFENNAGTLTYNEINLGFSSGLSNGLIAALLIGAILAPVTYAICWLVSRRWSGFRPLATTLWVFSGPVLISVVIVRAILDRGLGETLAELRGAPGEVVFVMALFFASAALLAVLVGGTYALATGSVRPSRRQRRALLVVVLLVVAVPIGVGAAFPMNDDTSEYDHDSHTNSETDALENADTDTDDDPLTDEELYGGSLTNPETYDNGHYTPRIENATALPNESDDVAVLPVAEADRPAANESASYPIGAVHADGTNVSVSNIELEVGGETVVPKAHYHITIDGVDESTAYQLGTGSYWAYNETTVRESGHAFAGSGPYAGLEGGFYVTMEQTESAHVYFDVVTEDGEIHRYVVELERTDV